MKQWKECKKCGEFYSDNIQWCEECGGLLYPVVRPNIFINDEYNKIALQDEIFTCGIYQTYKGGNNKYFDDYSNKILIIKDLIQNHYDTKTVIESSYDSEKVVEAINFFMKMFSTLFTDGEDYVVCTVPPHNTKKDCSGISLLAKFLIGDINERSLSFEKKVIDGTDVIQRIENIPKKSDTGIRDEGIEKKSITITNKEIIKNQDILLLDDVTTTGFSLRLYKKILLEYGAKTVVPHALGETWKYHMFGYRVWNP